MKEQYGIYKILNLINNKVYIGSTLHSLRKRWSHHKSALSNQTHRNPYLQKAWNKHGKSAFEFSIIEECDKNYSQKLLREKEDYWMKFYDSQNPLKGYNLMTSAFPTHSESSKLKTSEAMKGNKNPMYGKKHSEETKRKMAAAQKGSRQYFSGTKASAETKQKLKEAQIKRRLREKQLILFFDI